MKSLWGNIYYLVLGKDFLCKTAKAQTRKKMLNFIKMKHLCSSKDSVKKIIIIKKCHRIDRKYFLKNYNWKWLIFRIYEELSYLKLKKKMKSIKKGAKNLNKHFMNVKKWQIIT